MPKKRRHAAPYAFGHAFDRVDRILLAALQSDARLTRAELGRRVGMSAPAVGERLQRLEARGVVCGYTAQLDAKALGYPLSAVIRIRPAANQLQRVAQIAQQTSEVVECHRITGDDCYFMKLHLRDIGHLEQVLDRFTPYGQTTTSIIQSSPVPPRGIAVSPSDDRTPDVARKPPLKTALRTVR